MNKTNKDCWVLDIIGGVPKGQRHASLIRLLDRYFRLGLHYDPPWVEQILKGVPEGRRYISAIRLVGRWYAKGLYTKEVQDRLEVWNQRNLPPMNDSEVESILRSTKKWENPHCTRYLSDKEVNKIIKQINSDGCEGGEEWVD